jgi:uncharacterized protein YyaL (SSP411 family)/aryl-alcohol dehydrogenase-like predicted oxidoreductase
MIEKPTNAEAHTNRLAGETSPYLLQHAHNPVDWYPWGEEAFARARVEDRPILLSIGYSACHWCHVMERESFEDEEIGRLMSDGFVCIKVDREERPDLDEIYMNATVLVNQGQGGWPMTVFLTPEQEPFFAGTYFPPTDRWGRPGFRTLLDRIAHLWKTDRAGLREQARELVDAMRGHSEVSPELCVGDAELARFADQLSSEFDPTHGGFGSAPKFPPSVALSLLLRRHRRTGDAGVLAMVEKTLSGMAAGGMYDQVGGGFARYSTDDRWLVPHFEKMLYDNALLARVYLEAFQVTGDPLHERIGREVLDYVLREMTSPEGGFYSATDADSEGEEGKFFVWTPGEIAAALADEEEARRFCAYYDIGPRGNWEGKSIPNVPREMRFVARELSVPVEELARSLASARAKVYAARARRVPPGLDDKILTAWNGLMIGAMAEGYRVLGDRRYLEAGERAAAFLLATLRTPEGRLLRTYRAGRAHLGAVLEDHSYLASALLDLYEAGGSPRWLTEATRLADRMMSDFRDPADGTFFQTAHDHPALIVRTRAGTDGATPSGSAMAAWVLVRMAVHLGREAFRQAGARAIAAYGRTIRRHPRAFATSLIVVDFLLEGPTELALVGAPGSADHEAMRAAIARVYLPNRVIAHRDPSAAAAAAARTAAPATEGGSDGATPDAGPLVAGRDAIGGRATLYVCRDFACERPITDPAAVAAALGPAAPRRDRARTISRPLPGCAQREATAALAARLAAGCPSGYATLGATGLTVSRVGFGCYRVDDETAEHAEAMRQALLSGCNLIDTSTNYTDGGSERCVGAVLGEMVRTGRLRREEVVVVTKIGYVQGTNLEVAVDSERAGNPFPDMVRYMEGCWHCIHPDWLEDQLGRSLDRLQLATVDVCLLHNPEYYLSDARKRALETPLDELRDQFYRRLALAFGFLERQVRAGRIGSYGVSSNTSVDDAGDPEATSLSRMLDAAREAGGGDGHHFRVLQLPMNLLETGGALVHNTGGAGARHTALEAAAAASVAVLVNRPLNAAAAPGGGMIRLADAPATAAAAGLADQLQKLRDLESELLLTIVPALAPPRSGARLDRLFAWGRELEELDRQSASQERWQQAAGAHVIPRIHEALRTLATASTGARAGAVAGRVRDWQARYVPELQKALDEVGRRAAERGQRAADPVRAALDPLLPGPRRSEPLSRKALWVLASTPGVTSVLIGMRRPSYVTDAMAILSWPALDDPLAVLRATRDAATAPGQGAAGPDGAS